MDNINKAAVRAFQRIMQRVQEENEEGWRCDRMYDGGEFSGPAQDRMLEDIVNDVASRVGARYGLSDEDLLDMVNALGWHNHQKFMESRNA